jgi:tyrosinase
MTIRCPSLVGNDRRSAKTYGNHQLNYNLNWSVQDRVSLLLSFMRDHPYRTFEAVGSDQLVRGDFTKVAPIPGGRPSGSLENLHNTYHTLIGFAGHMGDPQYAAFDPVFWFHHANIDRYFALWQAANPHDADHPERWFPAPTGPKQTYDGEKPLFPFYKRRDGPGEGDYWASDDVQQTSVFGYVYDDFSRMAKLNQTVPEYMGKRYDWATRKPDSSILADMPISLLSSAVEASPFFHPPPPKTSPGVSNSVSLAPMLPPPTPIVPLNAIDPRFDRDWYVDSRVKRMAANGTFTIYFFLSPKGALPNAEPARYASSPYLVGMHHVFTSRREGCDNCAEAEEEGKLLVGTAPITGALLRYLEDEVEGGEGVESMRPEHVGPLLEERLRWRVVFHGFDRKDPREAGLQLKIGVSAKVYHDVGEPTYEEYPEVVDRILEAASAVASA